MRIFPLFLFLFFVSTVSISAQKTALKFNKYHWFDGIDAAKAQNKFFMMYIYQNGCEYCKELEKTFADKNFIMFVGEKFVLAKHNVKSKYGMGVAIDFKLSTTPALLIQNPQSESAPIIIYGVKNAEELEKELREILEK